MFRNTNSPQIHGLQAVSNQILVRKPPGCEPRPAGHPAALVIYGWDDCLPRHVAKYAEGLQSLYPRSREIVILALISKAMFSGTKSRSKHMAAVIDNFSNVFTKKANAVIPSILLHGISSTGLANYASTLNAFRLRHDRAHSHQLLICNWTPGSSVPSRTTLTFWSRAMALSTAQLLPWPFAVIYWLLYLMLFVNVAFVWAIGQEFPGVFTMQAVDDETLETRQTNKMSLYSKEDDMILDQDIEALSEEMEEKGYQVWSVMFEGSGPVKHMQKSSGKYWRSVKDGWRWALERECEPKSKL